MIRERSAVRQHGLIRRGLGRIGFNVIGYCHEPLEKAAELWAKTQSTIRSQRQFKCNLWTDNRKAAVRRDLPTNACLTGETKQRANHTRQSAHGTDCRSSKPEGTKSSALCPLPITSTYNIHGTRCSGWHDMVDELSITYYVSQEMLGVPSDDELERFKDLVLEALQDEWPEAQITIADDEDERAEIDGPSGQFLQDVEDRVDDIVDEILKGGDWREEEDLFADDEDVDSEESEI
jgi:hypothetical protein